MWSKAIIHTQYINHKEMLKLKSTTLTILSLSFVAVAFVNNAPPTTRRSRSNVNESILFGKYDPYDDDGGSSRDNDAVERNRARTDVRNFLTQRSIQSFVFLLNQVRDEQSVKFIEVSQGCAESRAESSKV